jgi:hypothetical protein
MQIIENLEFQKKHFPEIVESYHQKQGREAVKEQGVKTSIRSNIVICTDDFDSMMQNLFPIYRLAEFEPYLPFEKYSEILIKEKRIENIEVDPVKNSCVVELTHSYRLKHYHVQLVKSLKKKYIDSAASIIVYKKLDLFSKRALQKRKYKDLCGKSEEELKTYLRMFVDYYQETVYIEQCLEEKIKAIDTQVLEFFDQFDSVLGLDICNHMAADEEIYIEEDYPKFKQRYLKEFQSYSVKILEGMMKKQEFTNNFRYVDVYLRQQKQLNQMLSRLFEQEIVPNLRQKNMQKKSSAEMYMILIKEYGIKLDEVFKTAAVELKNQVLQMLGA